MRKFDIMITFNFSRKTFIIIVMLAALTGVEWRRDKKRPLLIKVPFTSQSPLARPLGGEER